VPGSGGQHPCLPFRATDFELPPHKSAVASQSRDPAAALTIESSHTDQCRRCRPEIRGPIRAFNHLRIAARGVKATCGIADPCWFASDVAPLDPFGVEQVASKRSKVDRIWRSSQLHSGRLGRERAIELDHRAG
jgi:hypothetical protein